MLERDDEMTEEPYISHNALRGIIYEWKGKGRVAVSCKTRSR